MKKKILAFAVSISAALAAVSCDMPEYNKSDSGKLSVVTTIFPQYDFVRQIAGDNVELTMLLSPGAESHTYEPTPNDIVKIRESDLFIYNGGEGDVWVDGILDSFNKPVRTLTMMDCVDKVEEEIVEGMQEEKDSGEEEDEPEFDEHVWTAPENAVKIVSAISEKLCEYDEQNSEIYRENTEKYIAELDGLDKRFRDIVSDSNSRTLVFGDRFPFRYFADAYGLDYYAAFPGCSSESEPSASTVAFLIDKVKEENIPVVFKIEFSSGKIAQTIAGSTDSQILEFHSCHNITTDDMKNGETYISIMNRNADNLEAALNP